MSRLSFIACFFAIYVGCVALLPRDALILPTPINDGDFLTDYFGSDSEIIPASERERAALLIKANHAVPRFTFFSSNNSLTRTPALFCSPHDAELYTSTSSGIGQTYTLDECDWSAYAESLLLISFVAFAIAIIIFPFLFCGLSLGRCCCCGKYKPTPELCCGDHDDFEATTNGYSDCNVLVLFVLSIACCVVMAAGAGVGIWGSTVMTQNVRDMTNFTNQTFYTFADIVDSVVTVLRSLDEMRNLSEVIDRKTLERADEVSDNIRNLTDTVAKYSDDIDLPRRIFMYVTLILPLVLMILVIISRFVCWWMAFGMSILGFILTFLSLCTFGFLYPLTSGIADICFFLDTSLDDPNHDPFLDSVFKCSPDSVLGSVTEIGNLVFEAAGNLTCSLYEAAEELQVPCDKDGDGKINNITDICRVIQFKDNNDECNYATFNSLAENTRIFNFTIGCFCQESPISPVFDLLYGCNGDIKSTQDYNHTLCPDEIDGKKCAPMYCNGNGAKPVSFQDCSESCADIDLAQASLGIRNYTNITMQVLELYNKQIKPYLNCESIVGITNHAKDFICVNMINSVTPMYIGEIIGAAGCFVGTFVALLSTKRFRKKYRKKYAILAEGRADIEL